MPAAVAAAPAGGARMCVKHHHPFLVPTLKTHQMSIENVRKSTRMYNEHSSADYIVENIAWSGEKLLHSCEAELRDMILSKALFLPQKEIGGPVYFKIMMDICNETNISPTSSPRSSKPKRLELQGLNTGYLYQI